MDDLNHDGLVNEVDVQIVIDATLQLGCVADNTLPAVTAINPNRQSVATPYRYHRRAGLVRSAIRCIASIPHQIGSGSGERGIETGQTATISMVLALEGPYNLIVTNVGGEFGQRGRCFQLRLPLPLPLQRLCLGQNLHHHGKWSTDRTTSNFLASVLNTVYPITGNSYGPHNSSSFQASVLNSNYTIGFPALLGQNDASVYASVLNTHFSGTAAEFPAVASLGSRCAIRPRAAPIPPGRFRQRGTSTSSAKPVPPTSPRRPETCCRNWGLRGKHERHRGPDNSPDRAQCRPWLRGNSKSTAA